MCLDRESDGYPGGVGDTDTEKEDPKIKTEQKETSVLFTNKEIRL